MARFRIFDHHPVNPAARFATDAGNVKALSVGRGLGEGECETIQFEKQHSDRLRSPLNVAADVSPLIQIPVRKN